MSHDQSSAKRAGRTVLELATLLSDGKWHRTHYLAMAAGKYMRPESAWRIGHGNISQGQRVFINTKLDEWERAGRVAKRRNGKFVEWRLAKCDWVIPYLRVLVETLREQAQTRRPMERAERDREILRLCKEGLLYRQIAERLGCHYSTVSMVLKASKAQLGAVEYSTLPLVHRAAIADAPSEKQPEIARTVAAKRLTVEETKRLVKRVTARNEHD